ncbi:DUF4395 domain-containing protein [Paenibacillus lutrae]|uniref:DUF4395 family protein n=1 Tax=Paenibacillus lutrae TaxID=2078573 RepID=A0A7X3FLP2_9BACL|nr:DUF4395 domain-containing protein [Paenibacillus lutrae]MVP02069.1 DUF4395 family protein [Paenibacillus lutrae]
MHAASQSIPRPLVRTNQWVIVLSVLAALLTGLYWILAVPLVSGVMGVLFNFNPVMRTATLFLRKEPSSYIPEDKGQQSFNQLLAIMFLLTALIGYLLGWNTFAFLFSAMVGLAAFVAILGFCIGCFVHYQWNLYKYRRKNKPA